MRRHQIRDPRQRASRIGIFLIIAGMGFGTGALLSLIQGAFPIALFCALYGGICAHGTRVMHHIAATP